MRFMNGPEAWEEFADNTNVDLNRFGMCGDGFNEACGYAVDSNGARLFEIGLEATPFGLVVRAYCCLPPDVETSEALEFANLWNENETHRFPRVAFDEEEGRFVMDALLHCVYDAVFEPSYFKEFFNRIFQNLALRFVAAAQNEFGLEDFVENEDDE